MGAPAYRKKDKGSRFIMVWDAANVQPDMILGSVEDMFKVGWMVEAVAQRVKDKMMIVTMRASTGGRAVTREIRPNDIVNRVCERIGAPEYLDSDGDT